MAAKKQEEEEENARKEKAEKGLCFTFLEIVPDEKINDVLDFSSRQQIL